MDTLPDGQLETAGCALLRLSALSLSNPAMATPAKAPMDDEPITAREAKAMIWKAPGESRRKGVIEGWLFVSVRRSPDTPQPGSREITETGARMA